MLDSYKYSREELLNKILKSPVTTDGYYLCKNFRRWNNAHGNQTDKGYTFNRRYFCDKICFSPIELEVFMDKTPSNYDIQKMRQRDLYLKKIVKDDIKKKLYEKINGYNYTLNDLIDNTLYYFNYKF